MAKEKLFQWLNYTEILLKSSSNASKMASNGIKWHQIASSTSIPWASQLFLWLPRQKRTHPR